MADSTPNSTPELRARLVWAVFGLLVVLLAALLIFYAVDQARLSRDMMEAYETRGSVSHDAFCFIHFRIAIDMARSGTALRYLSITLGGLMVVLGTLLTLIGVEANYKLNTEAGKSKLAIESSSPGLVMVTLGVVAIVSAVYRTQTLSEQDDACLGATASTLAAVAPPDSDAMSLHDVIRALHPPADADAGPADVDGGGQ